MDPIEELEFRVNRTKIQVQALNRGGPHQYLEELLWHLEDFLERAKALDRRIRQLEAT